MYPWCHTRVEWLLARFTTEPQQASNKRAGRKWINIISKRIIKQTNMKWGYPVLVASTVFLKFIVWLSCCLLAKMWKKTSKWQKNGKKSRKNMCWSSLFLMNVFGELQCQVWLVSPSWSLFHPSVFFCIFHCVLLWAAHLQLSKNA